MPIPETKVEKEVEILCNKPSQESKSVNLECRIYMETKSVSTGWRGQEIYTCQFIISFSATSFCKER